MNSPTEPPIVPKVLENESIVARCEDSICSLNQLCSSGVTAPVQMFMTNRNVSAMPGLACNIPAAASMIPATPISALTRPGREVSSLPCGNQFRPDHPPDR